VLAEKRALARLPPWVEPLLSCDLGALQLGVGSVLRKTQMKFVNKAIKTITDSGTPSNHNISPLAILASDLVPQDGTRQILVRGHQASIFLRERITRDANTWCRAPNLKRAHSTFAKTRGTKL
jgi:hypothetical protein